MRAAIEAWLAASRKKLQTEPLTSTDLDNLAALVEEPRQHVLYLYSKSSNMRSSLAAWTLYDPSQPQTPTLPAQEPPYPSVLAAVADGWRIVQFPDAKLYAYQGVDNDYIGFEFILEKMI